MNPKFTCLREKPLLSLLEANSGSEFSELLKGALGNRSSSSYLRPCHPERARSRLILKQSKGARHMGIESLVKDTGKQTSPTLPAFSCLVWPLLGLTGSGLWGQTWKQWGLCFHVSWDLVDRPSLCDSCGIIRSHPRCCTEEKPEP